MLRGPFGESRFVRIWRFDCPNPVSHISASSGITSTNFFARPNFVLTLNRSQSSGACRPGERMRVVSAREVRTEYIDQRRMTYDVDYPPIFT